jgi:hypothetical protein
VTREKGRGVCMETALTELVGCRHPSQQAAHDPLRAVSRSA